MTEKTPRVNPVALATGAKKKFGPLGMSNVEIARNFQLATEKINPLIARAEKALAALQLNVPAGVPLLDDPNADVELAFRKSEREWCLFVDSGFESSDQADWDSVRLHTASREYRLRALTKLKELEDALVSEALRQHDIALNAVAYAEDYLTELEARKP